MYNKICTKLRNKLLLHHKICTFFREIINSRRYAHFIPLFKTFCTFFFRKIKKGTQKDAFFPIYKFIFLYKKQCNQ